MDHLGGLVDRDAEEAREQRVLGLVTAVVTAINADGTYELSYLSMGDDDPSAPARIMMPMAGAGRGTYFLPEPGDEVVVAFELGDTSLPIVMGGVWNDNDAPPDQANPSPDNNVRTIVSRSGHEITLDDTPGAEKVTVKTQGGHELELDDTMPGSVTLKSAGGCELDMSDATGSLTLRAPLQITLDCPSISIKASGGLAVQAPAGVQLTTTGSVAASAVVIDGQPFGLHVHQPPIVNPPGTTGPVKP
jgi:phage baseplate assembly protein gpV